MTVIVSTAKIILNDLRSNNLHDWIGSQFQHANIVMSATEGISPLIFSTFSLLNCFNDATSNTKLPFESSTLVKIYFPLDSIVKYFAKLLIAIRHAIYIIL